MDGSIERFKLQFRVPRFVEKVDASSRRNELRLARVFEHGSRNGWSKMSLGGAETIVCMERTYFSRVFKCTVGHSFIKWRKAQMLLVAINCLEHGYLLRSTINLSGFGDRRTFERACKSMLNVTPMELEKEAHMSGGHRRRGMPGDWGRSVRAIAFPLAFFISFSCFPNAAFAAEENESPGTASASIKLFEVSFSRPVDIDRMYALVMKHEIPQVMLFVDLPRKEGAESFRFPVRMGYVEGTYEYQRERTRCELSAATQEESIDFAAFSGERAQLLATDAQLAMLASEGIPLATEPQAAREFSAREFASRVPGFLEQGRYWNIRSGVAAPAGCARFERPARQPPQLAPPLYPPMPNYKYPPALDREETRA